MVDSGLMASGVLIVFAVAFAAVASGVYAWGDVFDALAGPVVGGVLAGRFVAAVLDDPMSLRSVRAFLVIRGGVEFWPGVAVITVLLSIGARRRRRDAVARGSRPAPTMLEDVAASAPFLVWGYATYEATCVVREGCYGPVSRFGFTPAGLDHTMVPIGLLMALALALLGALLLKARDASPVHRLLDATLGVAAVRSVGSIWLPRFGPSLTRQHRESVAVLGVVVVARLSVIVVARRCRPPTESPPDGGVPAGAVRRVPDAGDGDVAVRYE